MATPADIQHHVFGEHPLAFVVMADWGGAPAGFALWFYDFSTWFPAMREIDEADGYARLGDEPVDDGVKSRPECARHPRSRFST